MNQPQIYQLFADLLEYPSPILKEQVRESYDLIVSNYPQVSEPMQVFLNFVESTSRSRLEEIYTSTFDLNPTCYPYAGYQLFGEGYKRGEFLAKLKKKYREHSFTSSNELADHLTVLLRFLTTLDAEEILAQELIEDCLVPALQKMNEGFKNDNPYARILEALLVISQGIPQTANA